jgi:hypothetical protein
LLFVWLSLASAYTLSACDVVINYRARCVASAFDRPEHGARCVASAYDRRVVAQCRDVAWCDGESFGGSGPDLRTLPAGVLDRHEETVG